ncbi:MAG: hypothetical protein HDR24_13440 [Lachnospiraceae bacterium]|nr:hypothetical protein [Lachnospiraceae bacterium]
MKRIWYHAIMLMVIVTIPAKRLPTRLLPDMVAAAGSITAIKKFPFAPVCIL